jgi:hypothetical protein
MGEYLSFRRMVTPVFIQIIFWIAVAAIVIGAIVQIANDEAVGGVLLLILGPLGARIYAEILIVIFRIHDDVAVIRTGKTEAASPAAPMPGASP